MKEVEARPWERTDETDTTLLVIVFLRESVFIIFNVRWMLVGWCAPDAFRKKLVWGQPQSFMTLFRQVIFQRTWFGWQNNTTSFVNANN